VTHNAMQQGQTFCMHCDPMTTVLAVATRSILWSHPANSCWHSCLLFPSNDPGIMSFLHSKCDMWPKVL